MKLFTLLFAFLFSFSLFSQDKPSLRESDRIRINEAFRIQEELGDKIWQNWDKVPFAIDLVTDSTEFLIRHPNPSSDFKLLGYDSLLQSNIYYRAKVFSPKFLASFPAFGNLSTIVVGITENTHKSSVEWIITLLHEHFHQLQSAQNDYYASVNKLDLAGGDNTGMWMLNYPFPYDDKLVMAAYDSLNIALSHAVNSDDNNKKTLIEKYLKQKEAFKNLLSEKDYKYFSFQLWQEGIARYTELNISKKLIEDGYAFSEAVTKLDDFISLKNFYADYLSDVKNKIINNKLNESKRVCFYAIGAGEGLLLDYVNINWKDSYFKDKFYLEKYFK